MGGIDWNSILASARQVKSGSEAIRLLNKLGSMTGLKHFHIAPNHHVLSATVGEDEPSPLQAAAAEIFDGLLKSKDTDTAKRIHSSNKPFWIGGDERKRLFASEVPSALCCPIRYGKSDKTAALFLFQAEDLQPRDTLCLQGVLVTLLERLVDLGVVSASPDHGLSEKECKCLDLYSRGHNITDIANEIGLDDQLVAATLNSAGSRLRAKNLAEAVASAIRQGLI